MNTEASIYKMVENAYKVTLVAAFVLAFGLYWKRKLQERNYPDRFGFDFWISLEIQTPEGLRPPQLVGVLMSLGGMILVRCFRKCSASTTENMHKTSFF